MSADPSGDEHGVDAAGLRGGCRADSAGELTNCLLGAAKRGRPVEPVAYESEPRTIAVHIDASMSATVIIRSSGFVGERERPKRS